MENKNATNLLQLFAACPMMVNMPNEADEVQMDLMLPNCTHSKEFGKIASALVKALPQMDSARKDSENPHFKSKYADLTSIMDVAKPPLAEQGIAVLQPPATRLSPACIEVATILLHESGQWIACNLAMVPAGNTPQAAGSAISYGRRYGLAGILGITADDDDGNAASGSGSKDAAQAVAKKKLSIMQPEEPVPSAKTEKAALDPKMLKAFKDIKEELYNLTGMPICPSCLGTGGPKKSCPQCSGNGQDHTLYYSVLKKAGYAKSNTIPTRDEGIKVYNLLGGERSKLIHADGLRSEIMAMCNKNIPMGEKFTGIMASMGYESLAIPAEDLEKVLTAMKDGV